MFKFCYLNTVFFLIFQSLNISIIIPLRKYPGNGISGSKISIYFKTCNIYCQCAFQNCYNLSFQPLWTTTTKNFSQSLVILNVIILNYSLAIRLVKIAFLYEFNLHDFNWNFFPKETPNKLVMVNKVMSNNVAQSFLIHKLSGTHFSHAPPFIGTISCLKECLLSQN